MALRLKSSRTKGATKSEHVLRFGGAHFGLLLAGVSLMVTAAACGTDDTPDLLGGPGPARPGDAGGAQDASAVDDGGYGPLDGATAIALAEKLFRAIPDFSGGCGGANGSCHVNGSSVGMPPTFLAGPDQYKTIKAYDAKQSGVLKFIVADPTGSRLFTKSNHAGQPLDPSSTLGIAVKKWLDVEAAALEKATLPASAPVAIAADTNVSVDISSAGAGIAGAKITFDAKISGTLLMMTNMKLVAPAAAGVHVLHPLFVQVPAMGKQVEDPADNFSNVDQTTGPGTTVGLGNGLVILTGIKWAPTDKLAIEFTRAEPGAAAPDAGAAGGCKNLAGFQALAPQLTGRGQNPNCTASCHKSGGAGDGALDLNGLVLSPPDFKAACTQALTRVNLADKAKSELILHPTGGSGNHQGGVVSDPSGFTTAVMTWLNGE